MSTENQSKLRLLVDGPQEGAVNMAVDEAILGAVNKGKSSATLRFYQWDEPTISLGYFQKYEELAGQDEEIRKMPVVRRQTGGGAILHDDELTYSLILPLDGTIAVTDIEKMYQLVHNAFIVTLGEYGIEIEYRGGQDDGNSQRGPFFCFARRHRLDLIAGGDKLVGSAQRRVKNAVLQHGSLILERHFTQQPSSEAAKLAQKPINLKEFIPQVAANISKKMGLSIKEGQLSENERERSIELQKKYSALQQHSSASTDCIATQGQSPLDYKVLERFA